MSRYSSLLIAGASTLFGLMACRANDPREITLNLVHQECTCCLDGYVLDNPDVIPLELRRGSYEPGMRDVVLRGENPFERGFIRELWYGFDIPHYAQVTGRFEGLDSENACGPAPAFRVRSFRMLDSAGAHTQIAPVE